MNLSKPQPKSRHLGRVSVCRTMLGLGLCAALTLPQTLCAQGPGAFSEVGVEPIDVFLSTPAPGPTGSNFPASGVSAWAQGKAMSLEGLKAELSTPLKAADPLEALGWHLQALVRGVPGAQERVDRLREEVLGQHAVASIALQRKIQEWTGRDDARVQRLRTVQLFLCDPTTPAGVKRCQVPVDAVRSQAMAGDVDSMFWLAQILSEDPWRDETGRMVWLRKAAERGLSGAAYDMGRLSSIRGEEEEARTWFERAARLGHARAAWRLGKGHERGDWADSSMTQAIAWAQRAAMLGEPEAAAHLSTLYRTGDRVQASDAKAFLWHRVSRVDDAEIPEITAVAGRLSVEQVLALEQLARQVVRGFTP